MSQVVKIAIVGSDLAFDAGKREMVLGTWDRQNVVLAIGTQGNPNPI